MRMSKPAVLLLLISLPFSTSARQEAAADGNAPMRMESCNQVLCEVSSSQLLALDKAKELYADDHSSSKIYSAIVDAHEDEITITLLPAPLGAPGRAISYVFDRSGRTLKRSFVNR